MHSNTTSTSATVIGARHLETEKVSLSARPQITHISQSYEYPGEYLRLTVGYSREAHVYGYNFKNTLNVYLSAHTGVYTNSLSDVNEYNLFSNTVATTGKDLLSQFPAFSGQQLDKSKWHVVSDNSITVNIPATQGTGKMDLIISNVAGYAIFTKELSGCSIVVST